MLSEVGGAQPTFGSEPLSTFPLDTPVYAHVFVYRVFLGTL